MGTDWGWGCAWGATGFIGHPEGTEQGFSGSQPAVTFAVAHGRQAPAQLSARTREPLAAAAVRPASHPVVTTLSAMAAAGGARFLSASSVVLGGAARRWLFLAGASARAGGLPGTRGPGGSAEPGLAGGAAAIRTLSLSARARSG